MLDCTHPGRAGDHGAPPADGYTGGMTSTVSHTEGPPRLMGHVFTRVVIANAADQLMVERGLLEPARLRKVVLDEVLVDTGATHLALPAGLIHQLGLRLRKTVEVSTATGLVDARVFRDADLEVQGRTGTFDCLELAEGAQPLLGVVPLEVLGLEPDLKRQRLRLLPETGEHTHLLAY